jgi:hypothetical protein
MAAASNPCRASGSDFCTTPAIDRSGAESRALETTDNHEPFPYMRRVVGEDRTMTHS